MCGLSGYLVASGLAADARVLRAMSRTLAHRGPDGEGFAFIETGSGALAVRAGERTALVPGDLAPCRDDESLPHDLALAHGRFAITDPTTAGHQPFIASDAPLALTFNGEIYNHVELRDELSARGHVFRTRSDVEVLARAWLEWGEGCFSHLRGFWALALWDGRSGHGVRAGRVLLARDPLGKAPLYVARRAGRLWWASEIKALRAGVAAAGGTPFAPRAEAISLFVRAGLRDFDDKTFYEGLETFPAAHYAWVEPDGSYAPRRYWSFPARRRAADIGVDEAVTGLAARLRDAVDLRRRADVPVALELSGGMDSAAIAALAARGAGVPLEACTVSFPGTPWDEAPFARAVAARYAGALRLHEMTPDNASILQALPAFQRRQDEPFHSPVLIANEAIWRRMAARGIRVSLNGAGGDEVFAGYGSEYLGPHVRGLLARGRIARALREIGSFSEHEADMVRALARVAWWTVPEAWRNRLRPAHPPPPLDPLRALGSAPAAAEDFSGRLLDHLSGHKMNYWLRSGNTAFMGIPIEVRMPLLDVRVVEWACTLPAEYLVRDGWMKWILRKALEPHLPAEVAWRKRKMGFPFPLREWLLEVRGSLEYLRAGEDPPGLDRAAVFAVYGRLAASHPVYLWRCLSVLMWWNLCVEEQKER